jgi:hypothetical protein
MKKSKQEAFPGFECCLQMLHNRDAMTQEEGDFFLSSRVHEYLDQLLAALRAEKDSYIQGWLLEIIGEAKSPVAFPILIEYWWRICMGEVYQSLRRKTQPGRFEKTALAL